MFIIYLMMCVYVDEIECFDLSISPAKTNITSGMIEDITTSAEIGYYLEHKTKL